MTNIIYIIYKLLGESLLSLYPIFVKFINLPLFIQLWSRFFTYMIVSAFFVDWSFIKNNIFTKWGISLFLITIIHVYTSYRGFQLLDSGLSYALFYTYPIFILLLSHTKINPMIIITLIGTYLLIKESNNSIDKNNSQEPFLNKIEYIENYKYEGIIMILLAAFTEALIFFIIKNIKTENSWNHVFLSYGIGAIILTIYNLYKLNKNNLDLKEIKLPNNLILSLILNGLIGLFGYLFRFKAMYNLPANIYAPLSYFGILMAYIYGILFNNETINLTKIIGTLMIIISNYLML